MAPAVIEKVTTFPDTTNPISPAGVALSYPLPSQTNKSFAALLEPPAPMASVPNGVLAST